MNEQRTYELATAYAKEKFRHYLMLHPFEFLPNDGLEKYEAYFWEAYYYFRKKFKDLQEEELNKVS